MSKASTASSSATSRSRTLYARNGFAVRDDIMEAHLDEGRALH